jgi:hypothetical protein
MYCKVYWIIYFLVHLIIIDLEWASHSEKGVKLHDNSLGCIGEFSRPSWYRTMLHVRTPSRDRHIS